MAKSARASVLKKNHKALRAKVFRPVDEARTERLSAKLQELAAKPRPSSEKLMDLDDVAETEDGDAAKQVEGVDVQMQGTPGNRGISKKTRSHRVEKKHSRKKPKNKVVFPTSAAKRKRIAQSKKKSV